MFSFQVWSKWKLLWNLKMTWTLTLACKGLAWCSWIFAFSPFFLFFFLISVDLRFCKGGCTCKDFDHNMQLSWWKTHDNQHAAYHVHHIAGEGFTFAFFSFNNCSCMSFSCHDAIFIQIWWCQATTNWILLCSDLNIKGIKIHVQGYFSLSNLIWL